MCNLIWDSPNKLLHRPPSLSLLDIGGHHLSLLTLFSEECELPLSSSSCALRRGGGGGHHLNSITTHTYLLRKDPYGPLFFFAARPSSSSSVRGRMFHTTFLSLSFSLTHTHTQKLKRKKVRKESWRWKEKLSNYHDGKFEKPHNLIMKRII